MERSQLDCDPGDATSELGCHSYISNLSEPQGSLCHSKDGLTPLQGGCKDAMKSAIDDSQALCLNALHTSLRLIPRVTP